MVSTLYSLNLKTLVWTQSTPPIGSSGSREIPPPQARYFHSACAWGETKLVIFGGEGYHSSSSSTTTSSDTETSITEEPAPALQTLDDLHIYNVEERKWEEVGQVKVRDGLERPKPRYAHLGVVCTGEEEVEIDGEVRKREKSSLMIMGGQDIRNTCASLHFFISISHSR